MDPDGTSESQNEKLWVTAPISGMRRTLIFVLVRNAFLETLLPATLTSHSHEQVWRNLNLVFVCCFYVAKKIKLVP